VSALGKSRATGNAAAVEGALLVGLLATGLVLLLASRGQLKAMHATMESLKMSNGRPTGGQPGANGQHASIGRRASVSTLELPRERLGSWRPVPSRRMQPPTSEHAC
jgi:hypothetical protein